MLSTSPKANPTILPNRVKFLALAVCYLSDSICSYQTYSEQGGSSLGYAAFAAMIGLGLVAVLSAIYENLSYKKWILLVAALGSWVVVVLSAWGLGLTFVPGALLLTMAAIYARK